VARWAFVLATAAGEPVAEFLNAQGRTVTWRRDDPAEASLTVLGDDPVATQINELLSDLLVYRDHRLVFRGRIGATSDNLDGTTHTVQVSAVDYRGLLERRFRHTAVTWTDVDQSQIAWNLINASQSQDGGDVGITRGLTWYHGVTRTRNYEAGKSIGEAISQLGRVINGFEWDIDPQLRFRTWYPERGAVRDFVAEYGNTVDSVSRGVDPSEYANVVRYAGDPDTTTAVTAVAADIATRPEGRFEVALGDTELKVQQTVQNRADRQLAVRGVIRPSYSLGLRPGKWEGPDQLWIGDTLRVVVRSGRLDVNIQDRVEELTVTVDDLERVEVTIGDRRRRRLARDRRNILRRLSNLERR
jgi:hypothetical protein